MRKKIRNNANELYDHYIQKDQLIYLNDNFLITAGIAEFIEYENCLAIFDLIFEYQENITCLVQHWYFKRQINEKFSVYCKDFKGDILITVCDFIIDFYFDDLYLIVKNHTVCLPVEYAAYFK